MKSLKESGSEMGWIVLHDEGGGITQLSLEYFRQNGHRLGRIFEINLNQDALFSMEIQGTRGVMLLSGCNCGYGGEGPHGSVEILKRLGVNKPDLVDKVFGSRHVHIDLRKRPVTFMGGEQDRLLKGGVSRTKRNDR